MNNTPKKDIDIFLSDDVIVFDKYKNKTLKTIATDFKDDGTIDYNMNEHGYRSNSLNQLSEYNILTLGCSWTMGVGVNNERIWPSVIGGRFDSDISKNCRVFNYSMYGTSTSYISKILYKITKSHFVPDVVLIMWPGFSRRDYIREDGSFKKVGGFRQATQNDVVWKNDYEDKLFIELRNDHQDSMVFWESYKFVETIGKSHNIKIFHTIAGYYYEIFKTLNLKNTIDWNTFFVPDDCFKNDFGARDNEHPSDEWHERFANNFYEFIKTKIN